MGDKLYKITFMVGVITELMICGLVFYQILYKFVMMLEWFCEHIPIWFIPIGIPLIIIFGMAFMWYDRANCFEVNPDENCEDYDDE